MREFNKFGWNKEINWDCIQNVRTKMYELVQIKKISLIFYVYYLEKLIY
jgi:hypothetical protein